MIETKENNKSAPDSCIKVGMRKVDDFLTNYDVTKDDLRGGEHSNIMVEI